MPVSYPNEMRKKATREGTQLVTIDALGMHFQGPVSQEEAFEIATFLRDFQKRHRPKTAETPRSAGPADPVTPIQITESAA